MLPTYARSFSIAELNYTFYQIPKGEAVVKMMLKAPSHFFYTAKLTRTLTHQFEEDFPPLDVTSFSIIMSGDKRLIMPEG
jgi:uncharacterized protein YecE (DUF72 family)